MRIIIKLIILIVFVLVFLGCYQPRVVPRHIVLIPEKEDRPIKVISFYDYDVDDWMNYIDWEDLLNCGTEQSFMERCPAGFGD